MHIDTGFRPSVNGYPFRNTWRDTVLGVVASRGRCGGMVFSALDRFLAGEDVGAAEKFVEQPPYDSPAARRIWRRQLDSLALGFGANLRRFVVHTLLGGMLPLRIGIAAKREARAMLGLLDRGLPAPIGLVAPMGLRTVFQNHQILVYAADAHPDRMVLRVYDPNFPRRDDVTVEVSIARPGSVLERVGTQRVVEWRSAFLERYK